MRLLVLLLLAAIGVRAGSWLDKQKPDNWNTAEMTVPKAPKMANPEMASRCDETLRPATLATDKILEAAGWRLFGAAQVFGDITVVRALAGYDGMCRPGNYQGFVFYKGRLAGTMSPRLMDARTDASLGTVWVMGPTQMHAEFVRYSEKDPLCCPSATTDVSYELDVKGSAPLLVPVYASTNKKSAP